MVLTLQVDGAGCEIHCLVSFSSVFDGGKENLLFVDITPWKKISFIVARTLFLWDEVVFHGGDERRMRGK